MRIKTSSPTPPRTRVQIAPVGRTQSTAALANLPKWTPLVPTARGRTPPIGGDWLISDLLDLGFDATGLTGPTSALGGLKELTPGGSITIDFLEGLDEYDDGDAAGVIAKAADLVERFDPDGEEIVIPMRIISSVATLTTAGAAKQFDAGANLIIQGTKFFDVTDADGSVALAGQIGAAAGFAKSGAKLYLEWNDDSWNFQDLVVAVDFVGNLSGFLSSVGIATNTFTTVNQIARGLTQLSKGIDA